MTAAPLTRVRRTSLLHWAAVVVLLVSVIATQVALDGAFTTYTPATNVQWVQSTGLMRRLALGFDAFVADVYWIRRACLAAQALHNEHKNYDLCDAGHDDDARPLHDRVRFAAILLSEGFRTDQGGPRMPSRSSEASRETPDKWRDSL
jgi:hypothetical protein